MRDRSDEVKRRDARNKSYEWKDLVNKSKIIAAELTNLAGYSIVSTESKPNDSYPFTYGIVSVINENEFKNCIKSWESIAQEMLKWHQDSVSLQNNSNSLLVPRKYAPPLWLDNVENIKVASYEAATSIKETLSESISRIQAFFEGIKSSWIEEFISIIAYLPNSMEPLENELRAWAYEYRNEKLTQSALIEAYLDYQERFQVSAPHYISPNNSRFDKIENLNCQLGISLLDFIKSQEYSWFGLAIAENYPSIAKRYYSSFPSQIVKTSGARDVDDSLNIETISNNSDSAHIELPIFPLRALDMLQKKATSFITEEHSKYPWLRVRHPHRQRRIAVSFTDKPKAYIPLNLNGVFFAESTKNKSLKNIENGDANTNSKSDLQALIILGKYQICRPD